MNIATGITLSVVAIVVIAIVINEIKKRKRGEHSCSCGGSCGACPMNCGNKSNKI